MRASLCLLIAVAALWACGTTPPAVGPTFEHKPPPDDPTRQAPKDGMAVEGLLGTLDDYDIQEAMTTHMAGFNNCFSKDGSTYISGEVQLSFQVGVDGRVAEVYVSASDLGSWLIEDCLVRTARFLEFAPPQGGPAKFIYPLRWNEAGSRITRPVDGSWGYEAIRAERQAVRGCRATHDFPGPFHLTVYVGPRGRLLSAGFHANRAAGDFAACVVQALTEARFPDPGTRPVKFGLLVEDLPDT